MYSYDDPVGFISAFYGCLIAGIVPVPIDPPVKKEVITSGPSNSISLHCHLGYLLANIVRKMAPYALFSLSHININNKHGITLLLLLTLKFQYPRADQLIFETYMFISFPRGEAINQAWSPDLFAPPYAYRQHECAATLDR